MLGKGWVLLLGAVMKILRILGAVLGTVALIGMFSCGGSSYLSEDPSSGGALSTGTFIASGITEHQSTPSAKDYTLEELTGSTDGSGDSFLDNGNHWCTFEFEATTSTGLIEMKSTAGECSGINNCGYCDVDLSSSPNCQITCVITAESQAALAIEYLEIRYVDNLLIWSDAPDSGDGALRIEGES